MVDIEKKREYQRQWVAKRRADYFADKSCVVCGSTENLELDHIDPSTKVSHRIFSWSQERREIELAKCQVLCHDCHEKKTISQSFTPYQHGTKNMYKRHKCRCDECKAWNTVQKQRERSRAKERAMAKLS